VCSYTPTLTCVCVCVLYVYPSLCLALCLALCLCLCFSLFLSLVSLARALFHYVSAGMGTAKMRHAITDGFRGSIESMKESCGLEPHDVVHMMLVTQYLDVLKEFAQVCV